LSGPEESQQLPILATFPFMDNLYSHCIATHKLVLLLCHILSGVVFMLMDHTQVWEEIFYTTERELIKTVRPQ
jgi:hypothetical protein